MLKLIEQEPSMTTPLIKLDPDNGTIEIAGNILTVDCTSLFEPILEWIDLYCQNPIERTIVKFHLEYFNTKASKYLLEVLKRIEKLYLQKKDVTVKWVCDKDDYDMIEAAEDYKGIIRLPILIIER